MESLLWAVGIGTAPSTPSTSRQSRARSQHGAEDVTALSDEALLPDLASIAAATEKGILALEEEAKSLERLQLQEASTLVRRWSQGLRRKPRPDEPLASFKAQFLRSNALEKALEGLRRNEPLRSALLDPPLFAATAGSSSPEEALQAELRSVLQLCLPRAAAPLAAPVLRTVLTEPTESVAAALTAVRALKEDWTEVVRGQALRGLERRLDSLAYELQKTPLTRQAQARGGRPVPSRDAASTRRASHDRVAVLALLCEAIEQSHARAEAHSAEIAAALRVLGVDVAAAGAAAMVGCSIGGASARADQGGSVGGTDTASGDGMNGGTGCAGADDLPSLSDCEAAISSMVSKTERGMRDGLRLLGLPGAPLHFVPGLELRLCGHDIRVAVNAMIAHWLEEERGEFFDVLQRIRRTVDRPALEEQEAELLRMRAALASEQQALLERLRALEAQLCEVDTQLARLSVPSGGGGTSRRSSSVHEGCASLLSMPSGLTPPNSSRSPLPLPEFNTLVANVAEAQASETQRTMERLATQLQQRRVQLLAGLTAHLESEQEQFSSFAHAACNMGVAGAPSAAGAGATSSTNELLEAALQDAHQLCGRVEAVTGGRSRLRPLTEPLPVGTRCRAKWMDGNYYDATVQKSNSDGTVVVNWLRPRPAGSGDTSPTHRPLITVSECGGDDTLHRIVMKADLQLDEGGNGEQSDAQAALRLFEARPPEDRHCVDCGASGADWASVSFGTYLCRLCAEDHQALGVRLSLARQLNDGWGWVQRDLQYLIRGGNAAFRACLDKYPAVKAAPFTERYSSRFAEYYRRYLDAVCTGAQLPQPPSQEVAAQAGAKGEFLSAAEAAAVAQEVARRFEAAVHWAASHSRAAATPGRSVEFGPKVQPGKMQKVITC